ncbi:MAG: FAD-dependent oxidoreductase [Nitrospiraceae bacterium]|nr:FAD-dependent oxidoreductase [Nitrospiraceae bacterium]
MKRYDLIVIGGGISGLSLAHYASRAGMKTLLAEKEGQAGGCLRTMRKPGDFWLELGAHTCYNSYGNLIGIIEDSGAKERLIPREKVPFMMFVDGKVKSIPSQLDFLEMACSGPRIFTLSKSGRTVASYYSKIVGKKNYEKVIGPALSAVPSQRADDFPAEMLFKKRKRRKDVIRKFTLEGGLQAVADAVSGGDNIELLTGAEASSVERDQSVFRVSFADGREGAADNLALAVPPPAAAGLLGNVLPEAARRLAEIKTVAIESVGVAVRKEAVALPHFAGLIPVRDVFFSAVSRDIIADPMYRGFTFHFAPGIDLAAKMKRIAGVLGTGRFEVSAENRAVLPSPLLGHEKITAAIDGLIKGKRVCITGNYFSGLAIEDCVTRSLSEFRRLTGIS